MLNNIQLVLTVGFLNIIIYCLLVTRTKDTNGDRIRVSTKYEIEDVNEKHIIARMNDEDGNVNYFILDKSGKLLLKTDALMILDDMYLIRNEDKKMSLYDENLNEISERYDKIIPNNNIDLSKVFSSYN